MRSTFSKKNFLFILFFLLLIFFIGLSIEVAEGDVFSFDKKIFLWTHSIESNSLTTFALACTFLGSQTFLLPANIILAGIFLFNYKHRAYAWKIALVSATSAGFLFLVKYIVKRPRPESPLLKAALHYSYPSGHTFTSITFIGILLYFALTYFKNVWGRALIIFVSVIIIFSIGWSRVYLHVHYASDVLGGFCLGIMWLILASWFLINKKENTTHL